MFAAIARRYDLNNRVHSLWRDQQWRRRAVSLCRVTPEDAVLDVACGTGDLAEAFAQAAPARVVGVDFTGEMLDLARRKAGRRHRPAGVPEPEYLLGDAVALAFGQASFDIVSIGFGLRNIAEPRRALCEFRRVLRPGGRLVVLEFSRPRHPVLRRLSDWYCRVVMPITATLIAVDRSGAYRYLPCSVPAFADRQRLMGMMASAGFSGLTQHPMTCGICVAYLGEAAR